MAGSNFSHEPIETPYISTKYRKIVTQIPVPESLSILERMYALESRSMHGQLPIIWDRAEGCQVFDAFGNIWIDFTSTIFVANAGHANKRIVDALNKQIKKPLLHTYTYATAERVNYLEYLIEKTPHYLEKAFLLSAGTEATEVALKLMRMNGQNKGKRQPGIVCFDGAYHGRTMGAQMMTGNRSAKNWIGYEDPYIHHLGFPYPWSDKIENPKLFFRDSIYELLKEKAGPFDQGEILNEIGADLGYDLASYIAWIKAQRNPLAD